MEMTIEEKEREFVEKFGQEALDKIKAEYNQEQEISQENAVQTTNNDNRTSEENLEDIKKEAKLQAYKEYEYNKAKNELIGTKINNEKSVKVIAYPFRTQNTPETQEYIQSYSENIESYDNGQNALNKVNEVLGNNVPRQGISPMFVQRTQNNNNFFWDNNTKNNKINTKIIGNFDKWLGSKKSSNQLQVIFNSKSKKNVLPNTNFNNFNKMFGTNKSKLKSKSLFKSNKKLNQILGRSKKFKF